MVTRRQRHRELEDEIKRLKESELHEASDAVLLDLTIRQCDKLEKLMDELEELELSNGSAEYRQRMDEIEDEIVVLNGLEITMERLIGKA